MSPILFKNKFNASVSTETFLIYRNGLCHSKFTHYEYKQLYTHVAKLKDGSNQNRNFIRGLGLPKYRPDSRAINKSSIRSNFMNFFGPDLVKCKVTRPDLGS